MNECCNAGKVIFILGEDKRVRLLVKAPNDEAFSILLATYELKRGSAVEAAGDCEVDGHYLDIKIQPQKKTLYTLEVTYTVADTIRKARVRVEVI